METVIMILGAILCLVVLGYIIKVLGNAFAFVFALIASWILVPQENRAAFFADVCDRMYTRND